MNAQHLVLGIALIGIGAKMLESSLNTECMSTPFFNSTVTPIVTIEDFKNIIKYSGSVSTSNFWSPSLVSDGVNSYAIVSSYVIHTNVHRLTVKNVNTGISTTVYGSNPKLEFIGDFAIVTSSLGTVTYDMINLTTNISLNISGTYISLLQQLKPFKHNDGKSTIVEPYIKYGIGFDLVGDCNGTINGINVSGLGVSERANWNFSQMDTHDYWWISINTPRIKGIFVQIGLYKDAGLWIDDIYYKPTIFEINTLSINPKNQRITFYLNDGRFFIINMTNIGYMDGVEFFYNIEVFENLMNHSNGLSWQENTRGF